MGIWTEVRRLALQRHAECSPSLELSKASELLSAAQAVTAVQVKARPAGDALLEDADAAYDPGQKRIYYSTELDPEAASFHIAHEFGHHWLDESATRCHKADFDVATPAQPEVSWVGEPDAYSPKERAEALANVFAREFLLPRQKLRRWYFERTSDAREIARQLELSPELVMQQLAESLLLPDEPVAVPKPEQPPDETQLEALRAPRGPMRIRAGPGTGKTRALVGRVERLVKDGEDPRTVAVLTFSNLSAQDLALRLRAALGEAAAAIWVGTFHALGLEILRKHGAAIGLPSDPKLLDRSASLEVLEELLPQLRLDHYLDLNEPTRKLSTVLKLISRAKDELATPADFEAAAQRQKESAASDKDVEEGEKSLEVARAYGVYDRMLRERGCVDFGDLIARPIELLRGYPAIRAQVRSTLRHVLADEYQDMNRASGALLQQLVEPGGGPWVVGDVRQAIYRFRGASPLNMDRFDQDFPGAVTQDLGVNYRSGGNIVRAFEAFACTMAGVGVSARTALHPHRGADVGKIHVHVASTARAEYEGIARIVSSAVKAGGHYRDHAVLARSHTTLVRLARHLEARGVPSLYFGDFFERPEIRDLLSLIQLVAEHTGIGLVRVAQLPQYRIPDADVRVMIAWRKAQDISMLEAVRRNSECPSATPEGKSGFARLVVDLEDVQYPQTAHGFLLRQLFLRGEHLAPLLADSSVSGQQKRLAIYQLLQFAFGYRRRSQSDPKRSFLEYIRRLELLDEEKQLRRLPAAAIDIDAVRLMTIHASKGLQFPVVHIPTLTNRHFPNPRGDIGRLPPALLDDGSLMTREAEEEALFFVALSRAQDVVHLSRGLDYGGWVGCKPSRFLAPLEGHLSSIDQWKEEGPFEPEPDVLPPPTMRESWPAYALETYLDCPRRFYYAEVLNLEGGMRSPPGRKLVSAVRATVGNLRTLDSDTARRVAASEQFAAAWRERGPVGHKLESLYRVTGEAMLETALSLLSGKCPPAELTLTLDGGLNVTCAADHVAMPHRGEVLIQRFKAGRLAKSGEAPKARYAVQQAAIRQRHPDLTIRFEHVSLLTGARSDGSLNRKKLDKELEQIRQVFTDIRGGRFHPEPDAHCGQCPYFFICPAHFRFSAAPG